MSTRQGEPLGRWLTVSEVADRYGLSFPLVMKVAAAPGAPVKKTPAGPYFMAAALPHFLASHGIREPIPGDVLHSAAQLLEHAAGASVVPG